jgi:hypothetical protein
MAYHLTKGLIEYLTRKEEFFVIIVGKMYLMRDAEPISKPLLLLGLDNAGKTVCIETLPA